MGLIFALIYDYRILDFNSFEFCEATLVWRKPNCEIGLFDYKVLLSWLPLTPNEPLRNLLSWLCLNSSISVSNNF